MSCVDGPIRILVADDHALMREGIASAVGQEEDLLVVAEAADGRAAIECYREHRPDVTLMDVQMPEMSGIDALICIRREFPQARIIMLTTYGGDALVRSALSHGASGFLLKTALRRELRLAIRSAHQGRRAMSAEVAAHYSLNLSHEDLTRREVEVLRHTAHGLGNKDIAGTLDVSEDTIKAHLKGIFRKLDARDRAHAVFVAMKRGIINHTD